MILGRPANLVLGAITAIINLAFLVAGQAGVTITPELVAAVNIAAGAVVALVAGQPPTLNPGDPYTVVTPTSGANVSKVANTNVTAIPPAQ
jgi:DNA-binding transcriptional LysR family regulator